MFIEAKVSFSRIVKFLEAPELQNRYIEKMCNAKELDQSIFISSTRISWDAGSVKATLSDKNWWFIGGRKLLFVERLAQVNRPL